jgi:hypothetical protein
MEGFVEVASMNALRREIEILSEIETHELEELGLILNSCKEAPPEIYEIIHDPLKEIIEDTLKHISELHEFIDNKKKLIYATR